MRQSMWLRFVLSSPKSFASQTTLKDMCIYALLSNARFEMLELFLALLEFISSFKICSPFFARRFFVSSKTQTYFYHQHIIQKYIPFSMVHIVFPEPNLFLPSATISIFRMAMSACFRQSIRIYLLNK